MTLGFNFMLGCMIVSFHICGCLEWWLCTSLEIDANCLQMQFSRVREMDRICLLQWRPCSFFCHNLKIKKMLTFESFAMFIIFTAQIQKPCDLSSCQCAMVGLLVVSFFEMCINKVMNKLHSKCSCLSITG